MYVFYVSRICKRGVGSLNDASSQHLIHYLCRRAALHSRGAARLDDASSRRWAVSISPGPATAPSPNRSSFNARLETYVREIPTCDKPLNAKAVVSNPYIQPLTTPTLCLDNILMG